MFITEVALVSETSSVTCGQVSKAAAALQKQASRDFGPLWNIYATVNSFERLEDVPVGYWPIIVRDDIDMPGAAGVHMDKNGQPFSLVQYDDGWVLTASHECLEMLADPWGSRLIAGNSPKPDQGRVEFLVEVADPPEAPQFGYTVNGLLVSDFLTPHFWDPVKVDGVRYSFCGSIPGPRQILEGGYISWHDPVSDHWWQQIWFGTPEPEFRDLGVLGRLEGSLRSAVDAATGSARRLRDMTTGSARLAAAMSFAPKIVESTDARAAGWREQIDALKAAPQVGDWSGGDVQG